MNPGCRRSSQKGSSLLELTVTMAVAAILAVIGAVSLDSGAAELTSAQQEIHGSLEQAFTLARARGTNVTVTFGTATNTGAQTSSTVGKPNDLNTQVLVPFGRKVKWGKPTHIPLPPGMSTPVVATLSGQAHATVTVTPRRTAEASTWFVNDGKEALCVRLNDHGHVQVLRWHQHLARWTRA
jgi:prepilin-type N-terminal cleavage/methylation domain-containing protein